MKKVSLFLLSFLLLWGMTSRAQGDSKAIVEMIKANLFQSMKNIKQYSWLETTKVYMKDELKSTKQNQCYYSVDGQLTKVATGATTAPKKQRGLKGAIAENKKEDVIDDVQKSVDLIKKYLPPDPEKLQQIYAGGMVGINILEPEKKFKLSFPDYVQKGDNLAISINKTTQKLMGLNVGSYLDKPEDKVIFDVKYKDLPDGTQYAATITLTVAAQNLKIVLENSGYRKGTGQ
jgi:hypothetical protein